MALVVVDKRVDTVLDIHVVIRRHRVGHAVLLCDLVEDAGSTGVDVQSAVDGMLQNDCGLAILPEEHVVDRHRVCTHRARSGE
jgi:hypothetical protein